MPLIIPGNSQASTGHSIDQSIRFNEAGSPYMQKTYSGDGSRTTWSFSFWMKLGKSPPYNTSRANPLIVYNTTSGAQEDIRIEGTNQQLQWYTHNDGGTGTLADLKTTQYLRDHSAWYHILCVADRTNAVSSERQRIYINGQRVTDFATETYPSQNAEGHVGKSADVHYIGSRAGNVNTRLDGYMAEIVYIDGTALDPSSFGEYNSSNIWIPKDVSGLTFGTNGFHIDGRDASDIGDDESGQGNDFTSSGIQTYDVVLDSPTNNFAVINILKPTTGTGTTVENGNLFQQSDSYSSTNYGYRPSTLQPLNSGKWYFEFEPNNEAGGGNVFFVGITGEDIFNTSATSSSVGSILNPSYGMYCYPNPSGGYLYFFYEGSSRQETNAPIPVHGNIIGVAVDFDNAKIYFFVNGTEIYGQNISAGTAATNLSGWSTSSNWIINFYTAVSSNNAARGNITFNFGQDSSFYGVETPGGNSDGNGIGNFKYSVPSGFLALSSKNLGS